MKLQHGSRKDNVPITVKRQIKDVEILSTEGVTLETLIKTRPRRLDRLAINVSCYRSRHSPTAIVVWH